MILAFGNVAQAASLYGACICIVTMRTLSRQGQSLEPPRAYQSMRVSATNIASHLSKGSLIACWQS